jgi:small ligand-binding sensory domain FIST
MKAGGALVLTADARQAARRAVDEARAPLGGRSPAFAVLFASPHFSGSASELVTTVAELTGGAPLIGCVASAVAGGAREVESGPAVSLWLAAGLGPASGRSRRSRWSSCRPRAAARSAATGSARIRPVRT